MIGFLTGNIISSKPTRILLDVNGVGYLVNISINTFEKITDLKQVSLFIFTNVKEDSITLFGFYSESEKEMFELLISVNGIGPKIALGILSGIRPDDLKMAVQNNEINRITAVPGIGRKTAERLMLELRSKIDQVSSEGETGLPFNIKSEAVSALSTLGYNTKVSEKVIRDILSADTTLPVEELIKRALAVLNN
jgi:holliday junction DNA helicase RuvA